MAHARNQVNGAERRRLLDWQQVVVDEVAVLGLHGRAGKLEPEDRVDPRSDREREIGGDCGPAEVPLVDGQLLVQEIEQVTAGAREDPVAPHPDRPDRAFQQEVRRRHSHGDCGWSAGCAVGQRPHPTPARTRAAPSIRETRKRGSARTHRRALPRSRKRRFVNPGERPTLWKSACVYSRTGATGMSTRRISPDRTRCLRGVAADDRRPQATTLVSGP